MKAKKKCSVISVSHYTLRLRPAFYIQSSCKLSRRCQTCKQRRERWWQSLRASGYDACRVSLLTFTSFLSLSSCFKISLCQSSSAAIIFHETVWQRCDVVPSPQFITSMKTVMMITMVIPSQRCRWWWWLRQWLWSKATQNIQIESRWFCIPHSVVRSSHLICCGVNMVISCWMVGRSIAQPIDCL